MGRSLRTIAVAVAFGIVAASCSSPGDEDPVPGVSATTVTIGSHTVLTGPNAPGNNEVAPAAKAYFDYVNDHGGVNGRKIIYDFRDDAYNPANAAAVAHRLVEQDKVFAVFNSAGTAAHQAVVGYLNEKKVPDLFPQTACPCWNDPAKLPYTFGWFTDYHREGKILGAYTAGAFPGKKIAYFYQDDDFGKSGVAGLDTVLPSAQVVTRQSYKPGYNDVTAQMTAIAQAGADVIVSFSSLSYTALLRLAQQKIGNHAQLIVDYPGADPTTLSKLLPSPPGTTPSEGNPLTEGIITDDFLTPLSDTSSSWVALLKTVLNRYAPGLPLDRFTEWGVAAAFTFVQALQRAGRDLTRESLIAAVEGGRFSPGFGLTPFDYSPTSHGGYTGVQIGVIRGNAIVLEGQPLTTDGGNGPVVPYTTPRPSAPVDGLPEP